MNRTPLHRAARCALALLCASAAPAALQLAAVEQALRVERASIQALELPEEAGRPMRVELSLRGQTYVLGLTPYSMRADGFQLLVQRADGSLEQREPAPPATYRGAVEGLPGSAVAASLFEGGLTATVCLAPGERPWCVQPLAQLGLEAARAAHAVYDSALVQEREGLCATPEPASASAAPPPAADAGGSSPKLCEVAIDCDTQFYTSHGFSEAATQADVESILNANEVIFEADLDITYSLTALIVRTFEPDPYSSFDIVFLLSQFIGEWTTNQADIPRDIAQLFTGKDTGSTIGVAYPGSVCDFGLGYTVVASNYTSDFATRVGLTAHEFAHNWGSGHCDGDLDCNIMCSLMGGCSGVVTSFGTTAKTQIEASKPGFACLDDVTSRCGFSTYGEALLNTTSLSASGSGRIGSTFTLTYSSPSSAPSGALTLVSGALGSSALGDAVLLLDLGTLVARTPGVQFATTGDTPTETLSIPNAPALIGAEFYLQAAYFLGPGAGLAGITELSNGLRLTICP